MAIRRTTSADPPRSHSGLVPDPQQRRIDARHRLDRAVDLPEGCAWERAAGNGIRLPEAALNPAEVTSGPAGGDEAALRGPPSSGCPRRPGGADRPVPSGRRGRSISGNTGSGEPLRRGRAGDGRDSRARRGSPSTGRSPRRVPPPDRRGCRDRRWSRSMSSVHTANRRRIASRVVPWGGRGRRTRRTAAGPRRCPPGARLERHGMPFPALARAGRRWSRSGVVGADLSGAGAAPRCIARGGQPPEPGARPERMAVRRGVSVTRNSTREA